MSRRGIQCANTADESARIGQIDIVDTEPDTGLGNVIVRLLERPGGMDDSVGAQACEVVCPVRRLNVERCRHDIAAIVLAAQFRRQRDSRLFAARGDNDGDAGVTRQQPANARAESARATDDNDAKARHRHQPRKRATISGVGTRHVSRRPNQA